MFGPHGHHLQGVRIGNWKLHFATRDGYYGNTEKADLALLFNIRQDPFESYEQAPGPRATLMQTHTYLEYMVQDVLEEHVKTLRDFPPVQKGASLNFDEMLQAIPKSKQ